MKKNILFFIASGLFAPSHASEPKESTIRYYRHEVNVGIGAMYSKQWNSYKDRIEEKFMLQTGGGYLLVPVISFDEESTGLHLSYYYHLNHRFSIGAFGAFTSASKEYPYFKYGGKSWKDGNNRIREKSTMLMPSIKCSFMNCRWCSLYMKALAGVHYQQMKFESNVFHQEVVRKQDEDKWRFAYMITPFGWEIGHWKIRGFVEIGIGSNQNIQAGLIYRFARYH